MTKDWNFNQPLESKSENQEDPDKIAALFGNCLLYTSPSPRDLSTSRMPSSA